MTPVAPAVRGRAPGKLILSGEHAVVYGRPALVTTIDRFAECAVSSTDRPGVDFDLQELELRQHLSFDDLLDTRHRLAKRYGDFAKGLCSIQDVLESPLDLPAYAAATLLEAVGAEPGQGIALSIRSHVPQGRGLGSSTSVIQALLQGLHAHLGGDLALVALYELALATERLQHGTPSGVDPYIVQHGGCIRFRDGEAEARLAALPDSLALIDTGKPGSPTGECVMQVSRYRTDTGLWAAFEEVTAKMERALLSGGSGLGDAVKENHALLVRIGVVPEAIQTLIANLEHEGTAAKICGAGAVSGSAAGMVWVVDPEAAPLAAEQAQMELLRLSPVSAGAHTAS